MAGTKAGGLAAAETNKKKHGEDFYARIGAIGGKRGKTGGFASELPGRDGLTGRERARLVGAIGGAISRRPKKIVISKAKPTPKREVSDATWSERRARLIKNHGVKFREPV